MIDPGAGGTPWSAEFVRALSTPQAEPNQHTIQEHEFSQSVAQVVAPNATPWRPPTPPQVEQRREDAAALRGTPAPEALTNYIVGEYGNEPTVTDFGIADETKDRAREIAAGLWQSPQFHYDQQAAAERRSATNAPIQEYEPGGSYIRSPGWARGGDAGPALDPWTVANIGREAERGPNYQPGATPVDFTRTPVGWAGDRLGEGGEGGEMARGLILGWLDSLRPSQRARFEDIAAQVAASSGLDPNDTRVRAVATAKLHAEQPSVPVVSGLNELLADPYNLVGAGFEGSLLRAGARAVPALGRAATAGARITTGAAKGMAHEVWRAVRPDIVPPPSLMDRAGAEVVRAVDGGVVPDAEQLAARIGATTPEQQSFAKALADAIAEKVRTSRLVTEQAGMARLDLGLTGKGKAAAKVATDTGSAVSAGPIEVAAKMANEGATNAAIVSRLISEGVSPTSAQDMATFALRSAAAKPASAKAAASEIATAATNKAARETAEAARVARLEARAASRAPVPPPAPRKGAPRTAEAKAAQTAGAERKLDEAMDLLPPAFVQRVRDSLEAYGKTGVSPESVRGAAGAEDILRKALADAGAKGTGEGAQQALVRRLLDREGAARPVAALPNEPQVPGALPKREAGQVATKVGKVQVPGANVAEANRRVPESVKDQIRRRMREDPAVAKAALGGNKEALEKMLNRIPGGRQALRRAAEEQGMTKVGARTQRDMLHRIMEEEDAGNAFARAEFGNRAKLPGGVGGGGGRTPPPPGSSAPYPGDVPPPAPLTDAERAAKVAEMGGARPYRATTALTPEREVDLRKALTDVYKKNGDADLTSHLMKQNSLSREDATGLVRAWTKQKNDDIAMYVAKKLGALGNDEKRVAKGLLNAGLVSDPAKALEVAKIALTVADRSVAERIVDLLGIPKTTFTAGDVSGAGRQARAFVSHPKVWGSELKKSFQTLIGKDPNFLERETTLIEDLAREGWIEAGHYMRDLGSYARGGDEAFPAGTEVVQMVQRHLGKPGRIWGKIVENSNEAYISMLNGTGGRVALDTGELHKRLGVPLTLQQKRDITKVINHGLGRLSGAMDSTLLAAPTVAPVMNVVFFSPQLRGARIAFYKDVAESVGRIAVKMPEVTRAIARREEFPLRAAGVRPADIEALRLGLGHLTSTAVLYGLAWKALGIDSVDLNPGSTSYMRADLGEYGLAPAAATALAEFFGVGVQQYKGHAYVDLSNGASQDIRTLYRLITGDYAGASGVKKQIKWSWEYPGSQVPPFTVTKNSVLKGYIANALSPSGRLGTATLGITDDDLTDLNENPILSTALFGIITNVLQSSGLMGGKADPPKTRRLADDAAAPVQPTTSPRLPQSVTPSSSAPATAPGVPSWMRK